MLNASLVPASILLAPNLSPSAKVIWACLQLKEPEQLEQGEQPEQPGRPEQPDPPDVPSTGTLVRRSGLARATVRRAVAELTGGGWLAITSQISTETSEPHATMPAELLADTDLDLQAKLLYAMLQFTPSFDSENPEFTVEGLVPLAGVSRNTVRRAARRLELMGWLELTQKNRASSIEFTLRNPVAERCDLTIARMNKRLDDLQYKGEAFMQQYLSLIIDSDDYEENARPGFLINPTSGEKLELDRYYPPNLAFEYHGSQHDGPTKKFPSTVKAQKQQARDLMKEALCARKGIELVVLRFQDLTLSTMLEKVTSVMQKLKTPLPLRDLRGEERVIAYLEELTEKHRASAAIIDAAAKRRRSGGGTGR